MVDDYRVRYHDCPYPPIPPPPPSPTAHLYLPPNRVKSAAAHFRLEHVRSLARLQQSRDLNVRVARRQVLLVHLTVSCFLSKKQTNRVKSTPTHATHRRTTCVREDGIQTTFIAMGSLTGTPPLLYHACRHVGNVASTKKNLGFVSG